MDKFREAEQLLDDRISAISGHLNKEDQMEQMLQTIEKLMTEHAYHDHFRKMLKSHGVSSPAQIPPEKRGAFFKAVSKTWKAKKK